LHSEGRLSEWVKERQAKILEERKAAQPDPTKFNFGDKEDNVGDENLDDDENLEEDVDQDQEKSGFQTISFARGNSSRVEIISDLEQTYEVS
jgi:hypothetical protein